jgi:hypothetical protein
MEIDLAVSIAAYMRRPSAILVAALLCLGLARPVQAQYLPSPEPVPDGISAAERQSLEVHYWGLEDIAAALEPLIEEHESKCGSVDTEDDALMAECGESEAFLSENIDHFFAEFDDYEAKRLAAVAAARQVVTSEPAGDRQDAFASRLDGETMRRLTAHQLRETFNLLLDARLAARGDDSPRATAEEVDRLYAEITPPWANPVPSGGFSPEQEAQLSGAQLLKAFELLLVHRVDQRGEDTAEALDEEADRLLREVSPAWFIERQEPLEAMQASKLPDDTDLTFLFEEALSDFSKDPADRPNYAELLDQDDDMDMSFLFDDMPGGGPEAREKPEDVCDDPIGCLVIRIWPFAERSENDVCGGDPLGCILIRIPSWGDSAGDSASEAPKDTETHVLNYPDLDEDPLAIDPEQFIDSCGGSYGECVRRWPEPETKTDYVLSALHYANVLAADAGLNDTEKWEFSLSYLAAQSRKDPTNLAARDALNYVEGLGAGASAGP